MKGDLFMPTRAELKQNAKDCIREQALNPILVTLVYTLIITAISLLGGILGATVFIPFILSIASIGVQIGYIYYCMKVAKREQGAYADLAYLIQNWRFGLKLVALSFLINILVSLWSLLFLIPGVIKAISYSQAIMIMLENPNIDIMTALKESQKMMDGHKMEYFVLDLSFILWGLLVAVTFGIASLWVSPYIQITMVNYYNILKNPNQSSAKVVLEY